jgi:V/A-type H+-transporting ATPase subunit D
VWLRARLACAARAADLLEQKERVLRREQRRLDVLVGQTRAAWESSCAEAMQWAARTAVLRGRRAIALAGVPAPARAELRWRNSMGAYYPAEAACRLPPARSPSELAGTAALAATEDAHRRALGCAVEHAATQRAVAEVARELRATQRRLRMLEHEWIPALESAMRALDVALEERERDDIARARWARDRGGALE